MKYNRYKRTILIDLDGVLNEYTGKFDEKFIPPVKQGVKEFLTKLSYNYTVKIFTTRNRLLTSKWLIDNRIDYLVKDVTNIKEPCWVYIDDRCINFDGDFDNILNKIDNFKPYYK